MCDPPVVERWYWWGVSRCNRAFGNSETLAFRRRVGLWVFCGCDLRAGALSGTRSTSMRGGRMPAMPHALRTLLMIAHLGLYVSSGGCTATTEDREMRPLNREIKQLDREIRRLEAEMRRDPQPLGEGWDN